MTPDSVTVIRRKIPEFHRKNRPREDVRSFNLSFSFFQEYNPVVKRNNVCRITQGGPEVNLYISDTIFTILLIIQTISSWLAHYCVYFFFFFNLSFCFAPTNPGLLLTCRIFPAPDISISINGICFCKAFSLQVSRESQFPSANL